MQYFSTRVSISPIRYLRANLILNLRLKARFLLGRFFKNCIKFYDHYQEIRSLRNQDRLTAEQINIVEMFQEKKVDKDFVRRSKLAISSIDEIKTRKSSLPMYQRAALLCDSFLAMAKDIGIKSVANVGARVDIISSYFARQYPDIDFYSLDFQKNLKEHNSHLPQGANWKFITGYPLEILEGKIVQPDLVVFSSTSPLFTAKEFSNYLKALRGTAKVLIFNEPWWPLLTERNIFKIPKPELLEPGKSYIAGHHSNFHYNYYDALARTDYKIALSRIIDYDNFYNLQIIAIANSVQLSPNITIGY